jgi:carbonic anhydrase
MPSDICPKSGTVRLPLSLPPIHFKLIGRVVVVVGHTNCGGAKAALEAVTNPSAPEGEPVLVRWLTPLLELAKNLVGGGGPAPPGTLTKLIEESVGVQVNNVANSEPVKKAWAQGRKVNVHGLIYELETGRLRDLHVTRHS